MFTMQAIATARQFILEHEVDVIRFINFELTNACAMPSYWPMGEQDAWDILKEQFVAFYVKLGEPELKMRMAWKEAMMIEHPLFC